MAVVWSAGSAASGSPRGRSKPAADRQTIGARKDNTMNKSIKLWRIAVAVIAVIAIAGTIGYYKGALWPFGLYRPSNALMVIAPY